MSERYLVPLTRAALNRFHMRNDEYDFFNAMTRDAIEYKTDFLGDTIDGLLAAGGAGTAAAVTTGRLGGEADLATGAVDNQCSTLFLPFQNFTADQNPILSVRIKISSLASGNAQIGWVDSEAAGVLGATGVGPIVSPLTATPTLTGSTADAVVALYDLSSGLTNPSYWRFAGARATTAWLVTPSTTNAALQVPTAGTYQWIDVAIRRSERGATDQADAVLYVNGIEIARKSDGAITNTVALTPFVLIGATSGTARTATLDAFVVRADRDIAA